MYIIMFFFFFTFTYIAYIFIKLNNFRKISGYDESNKINVKFNKFNLKKL